MPKKGAKPKGGNRKKQNATLTKRDTPFATEDQVYGKVTKLLGSCRMQVACLDGVDRLAHIRGAMQKRVWIALNDLVLVSLRSFQDTKGDIVYKYDGEEIHALKRAGEIPETSLEKPANDKSTDPSDAPTDVWSEDVGFVFTDAMATNDETDGKDEKIDIDAI